MAVSESRGTVVSRDDRTSFETFVRTHSDRLLRVARLVTGNWEDARDAVQDTLEAILPRWPELAASERLDGYVHRCVVNACLAVARRRGRSRPVAEPQLLPRAPVVGDPAQAVANADEAWRLCTELPAVQRAAVVLRFYEDLSFAEIADALRCPEATARSHVHRAIVTLRSRLKEDENHG
jgi:RNA polymerase sigma factor (sigma-70 family)